jgi:hypothetical protein
MSSFGAVYNAQAFLVGKGALGFGVDSSALLRGRGVLVADAKVNHKVTGQITAVGAGKLSALATVYANMQVDMLGVGSVSAQPASGGRGGMTLPELTMIAANRAYGSVSAVLMPLEVDASANDPTVPPPVISYGIGSMFLMLLPMSGTVLSGTIGGMDGTAQPLSMVASNRPYGSATMSLAPLEMYSYTRWGMYADSVASEVFSQTPHTVTADYALVFISAFSASTYMAYSSLYTLLMSSQAVVSAPLTALAEYSMLVVSMAAAGNIVELSGVEYDCVVVNASSSAISLYDAYEFNSFAKLGADYYAAGAGGIYLLGGDTDAGSSIHASITTMQATFASEYRKNVPYAYLGVRADGTVELTTHIEGGESQCYTLTQYGTDMRNERVTMARGAKSMYWQFDVSSDAPMDVDYVDVSILELKRRI